MTRHLVVMARRPAPGRVKSRLAKDIGALAATRVYSQLAGSILRRLGGPVPWRCWLSLTPDLGPEIPATWRRGWTVIGQGAGGLGTRMLRPARLLPPGPVVVVGSDIAGLDRAHVAAAFAALGRHDLVFGPAEDGGFWLVGFAARARGIDPFSGVGWSRPDTLAQCMARVPAGRRVALLETLWDVDTVADLRRFTDTDPRN